MNFKRNKQKNNALGLMEVKHIELIADKIIRTAKFEHTVESLDRGFSERWKHFKKAWLTAEFSC